MDDDDPFAPPGLEGELSLSVVNMLEMMDARIEKQLCEERERAAAEEASRLTRTEDGPKGDETKGDSKKKPAFMPPVLRRPITKPSKLGKPASSKPAGSASDDCANGGKDGAEPSDADAIAAITTMAADDDQPAPVHDSTATLEAMAVKDLKAFLTDRGVPFVGVTEKSELVCLAREAQAKDDAAAKKASTSAKPGPAPTPAAAAGPPLHLLAPKCLGAREMVVGFNTWRGPCRSVEVYEKLDNLGTGTFSTVYRVKDRKTHTVYALKKLKFDFEREGFPMEALREMHILLTLSHPNLIQIREVVCNEELDTWYVVMELMECHLGELIDPSNTPFSPAQVKGLMVQLCAAVAAMHECWVIHRDLKMPNLLMSADGVLKVCDFGLARRYGEPQKPLTPKVVSLWYRCPEILLGPKTHIMYSTAVDIWSVGCLFAELLSREVLFLCQTEVQMLDQTFQLVGPPTTDDGRCYDLFAKRAVKLPTVPHKPGQLRTKFPRTGYEPHFIHKEQCKTTALTDSGFDLLERCLKIDERKRITAAELLQHPWFREPPHAEFMPPKDILDLRVAKKVVKPAAAAAPPPLPVLTPFQQMLQQQQQLNMAYGFNSNAGHFGMAPMQFGYGSHAQPNYGFAGGAMFGVDSHITAAQAAVAAAVRAAQNLRQS